MGGVAGAAANGAASGGASRPRQAGLLDTQRRQNVGIVLAKVNHRDTLILCIESGA